MPITHVGYGQLTGRLQVGHAQVVDLTGRSQAVSDMSEFEV